MTPKQTIKCKRIWDMDTCAAVADELGVGPRELAPDAQERCYLYRVVQARNTITPPVGHKLTAAQVEGLIEQGVEVTIEPES